MLSAMGSIRAGRARVKGRQSRAKGRQEGSDQHR